MQWVRKIPYKIYFFLFSWLSFGELGSLLSPDADPFIYYHTITAFYPNSWLIYSLAIVRAVINILCLVPLFIYAFEKKRHWVLFFKVLCTLRIIADIMGHNFELQFLKATTHTGMILPLAAIVAWFGLSFLSYKAHFFCCYSHKHQRASHSNTIQ
jgi:hypothetical protein